MVKVSSVNVTNFWANYVTKFDIKGSRDGITWETLAEDISLGESESKLAVLPEAYIGRYIWIAPTQYSSDSWRTLAEVSVNGQIIEEDSNYALNKNVKAYTNGTDIQITETWTDLAFATDGSRLSWNPGPQFAQTTDANPDWDLVVDFEVSAQIFSIAYTPEESAYITSFDVYMSDDGVLWNKAAEGLTYIYAWATGGSGETNIYTFDEPLSGRYIKISPNGTLNNSLHRVGEIECYGNSYIYEEDEEDEEEIDVVISEGREYILVDSSGDNVLASDIVSPVEMLYDGDAGTYVQTASTFFGVIINFQGVVKVSSVNVTNFWANYVTKFDIKGSRDGI
ncbi:hypothetical protein EOM86_14860, partial [Candidatus Nomurabacteria bacterium]|nr:hypothetical protein [Candidatus Nomurabacteria bacterium]